MDATGSSAACSVLGNTLERGFGHSPYSDHAGQVVCMEVMLADGRIIQTVPRGPNDEIVLTVFGVQRYGAATRTKQYVGVFVPEKKEPYAQHFRLVDVIRVDASGLRSIERLDAKVVFDAKSGETSIAVPALENAKGDATGVPGKKVAIQLQLKNGRLLEVGR